MDRAEPLLSVRRGLCMMRAGQGCVLCVQRPVLLASCTMSAFARPVGLVTPHYLMEPASSATKHAKAAAGVPVNALLVPNRAT